jgi:NTP pyrophosphatase (non-canonical NTP hydrolase)
MTQREPRDRAEQSGLGALREHLRAFAAERDWDRFHSPKNLAMALAGEAGELLEVFQWRTEEESYALDPQALAQAREELADLLIYLVRLADKLDIDLLAAATDKIATNARKYPADRVRGSAKKYSDYDG